MYYVLHVLANFILWLTMNGDARARAWWRVRGSSGSEAKTCKIVPRGTTPLGKIKFPERKLVSDREGGREMN